MDAAGLLIIFAAGEFVLYWLGYRDGRTQAESDRLVEKLDELIKKEGER